MKKRYIPMIGAVISLILLSTFGWLQIKDSKLLQLPSQWLAMSVLPLITTLFIGGFITRFKGFGLELESTLKAPVTSLNLTAADAVTDIPGDEKKSIQFLKGLSDMEKQDTRQLLFRSGRTNFYTPHGVEKYLRQLPNIEFFEIRSEAGDIICLLPISLFRKKKQQADWKIDQEKIQKLIESIEKGSVPSAFPESAITTKVSSEQGLVDVLKAMRAEKAPFAAVESPSGKYLGVVFGREVERRIADSVLAVETA